MMISGWVSAAWQVSDSLGLCFAPHLFSGYLSFVTVRRKSGTDSWIRHGVAPKGGYRTLQTSKQAIPQIGTDLSPPPTPPTSN